MADGFEFNREKAEEVFKTPEGERLMCQFDDTADELHSAIVDLQEADVITGPPLAQISIYPESQDEPTPVLVVNDGQGIVLMGGHLKWPEAEDPQVFARELLSGIVDAANGLLSELAMRVSGIASNQEGGPELTHVYHGQAVPVRPDDLSSLEQIGGAFRILSWLPTGGAIVGNGESPEKFWATLTNPEHV